MLLIKLCRKGQRSDLIRRRAALYGISASKITPGKYPFFRLLLPKGVSPLEEKIAAVQMRDITKRFGSVLANDRVWLNIYKGEIMALLGERMTTSLPSMNICPLSGK